MRTIRFKKGKRRPVGSDNRWLKNQIRNAKTNYISVGFRFTEKSRYAIKSVGGYNDQNDWMKMVGTMSIANLFKKQAEELAAFRYTDKGEFQICRYIRSKATAGAHIQLMIQTCKLNQWYFVLVHKKYCLTVGAWAGGDGVLLNDFKVEVNILG